MLPREEETHSQIAPRGKREKLLGGGRERIE